MITVLTLMDTPHSEWGCVADDVESSRREIAERFQQYLRERGDDDLASFYFSVGLADEAAANDWPIDFSSEPAHLDHLVGVLEEWYGMRSTSIEYGKGAMLTW